MSENATASGEPEGNGSPQRTQESDPVGEPRADKTEAAEQPAVFERGDAAQRQREAAMQQPSPALGAGSAPSPGPAEPTPHINWLPDCALEKIFTYLSQTDIVKGVMPVCKRWLDVARTRILGRQLVFAAGFRDVRVPPEQALRLIRAAPQLLSLDLQHRCDAAELLQAAANSCKKLRRLKVDCRGNSEAVTAALSSVFRSCGKIQNLALWNIDIHESLHFFEGLGKALPKLRRLTVWCRGFGLAEISAILDRCPHLEEFSSDYQPCTDASVARLVQRWGPSLRMLRLYDCEITDAGLAALAACTRLRSLTLEAPEASGVGLEALAALEHLEELDLSYCSFPPDTWRRFFEGSRSAGRLRVVSIDHCPSADDSLATAVATACANVEWVDLCSCEHITAEGARRLLGSCRRLQYFNSCASECSMADVVRELPQLAPQLRYMSISTATAEALEEPALDAVGEKMPYLLVEW